MTGDGRAELVVSALYKNGSRVFGFQGSSLVPGASPAQSFATFTLGGAFASGMFLAVGDVDADGVADLVAGSAAGATASVSVYSGQGLLQNTRTRIASFAPAGASSTTGVRVGVRDIDGDGTLDIATASGERVSAYQGGSLPAAGAPALLFSFDPDTSATGVMWVG